MDFAHFKRTFKRHYESLIEEAARQKLFMARFLKAGVSQVKYRLGLITSYLGTNHLSDRTREERARLAMSLKRHPELLNSGNGHANPNGPKKGIAPLRSLYNYFTEQADSTPTIDAKRRLINNEHSHIKIVYEDGSELTPNGQLLPASTIDKKNKKPKMKDQVKYDLRDSGCFHPVGDQGDCGSCYAFTNIVLIEYLYCMSNKKLAKFSEQFVVDCGKPFELDGCEGGTFVGVANLIQQLGLEMDAWYPYRQRETDCPFVKKDSSGPGKLMRKAFSGYIRPKVELKRINVAISRWDAALAAGIPLDVSITTDMDKFSDYAGGVDKGGRSDDQYHSMTLIGSGRENGIDYWLLRNSFGPDWGIDGHYKLAKDSFVLEPNDMAETYSVFLDGPNYGADIFHFNQHYNHELVADKNQTQVRSVYGTRRY